MNYYNDIKNNLINNEIYKRTKDYSKNKSDLNTYYNVGKLLSEAGKHYGEGIIKEYSIKLVNEVNKRYSFRTLYKMRQFYLFFKEEKVPTLSAQLTCSHYYELLSIKEKSKVMYYIKIIEEQNLDVRTLRRKIKSNEYERLPENTKNKLVDINKSKVEDFIKDPILIKNSNNYTDVSEKVLKQLILEDLDNFLLELGNNFSYLGNEYKIKISDRYNYIDLLLYNI